jgi:hypothetical protein
MSSTIERDILEVKDMKELSIEDYKFTESFFDLPAGTLVKYFLLKDFNNPLEHTHMYDKFGQVFFPAKTSGQGKGKADAPKSTDKHQHKLMHRKLCQGVYTCEGMDVKGNPCAIVSTPVINTSISQRQACSKSCKCGGNRQYLPCKACVTFWRFLKDDKLYGIVHVNRTHDHPINTVNPTRITELKKREVNAIIFKNPNMPSAELGRQLMPNGKPIENDLELLNPHRLSVYRREQSSLFSSDTFNKVVDYGNSTGHIENARYIDNDIVFSHGSEYLTADITYISSAMREYWEYGIDEGFGTDATFSVNIVSKGLNQAPTRDRTIKPSFSSNIK